ncbi:proline-rich protein 23D1-like [Rhinolophus ferrumequinum]|uniref:proline-rich protein 23D1-like n=1 Tax=Rhinolophus ferrumequinum TaxID=59479 RepID=UPI00140F5CA3|nr:proline-rich protein 23D1-like [Rhinolophus ferrumequinum]
MYGFRRPRSPRDSPAERKDDTVGESRWAAAQWNPTKRWQVEQHRRTGAEPVAVQGALRPDLRVVSEPPQGRQIPSAHVIVVILEPGTDLQLRLGDEVLVLVPQTALQLTLSNVTVVVVPEHVLNLSEDLLFPAHARFLLPRGADTTWEINIEDGSLSAQHAHVPRAEEEGRLHGASSPRWDGPLAYQVPAFRPPSLSTLLLKPFYRAAAPEGCCRLPGPRPGRRPLPAEFSLDLHGLGPCAGSVLRPLPPSSSPETRPCRAVGRRPPSKARRRLF